MLQRRGFTIVELLIVIVVIGILAAITIVAYSGIQNRSKIATIQSDLSNAVKSVEAYKVMTNDTVPLSNDCSESPVADSICLKQSSDNTLTYTYDQPTKIYCIEGTNGSLVYSSTSRNTAPANSACPIINHVVNPSLETSIAGWVSNSVLSQTRIQTGGKWVFQGTRTTTGAAGVYASRNLPSAVEPNQTYTASATVTTSASATVYFSVRVAGTTTNIFSETFSTVGNVPQRLNITGSVGSWDSVYVSLTTNTGASGMTIIMDEVMLTKGSTLYSYADGSSSGWSWLGTPDESVSMGPPL